MIILPIDEVDHNLQTLLKRPDVLARQVDGIMTISATGQASHKQPRRSRRIVLLAVLLLLGAGVAVVPELTTPGAGMKMGDGMQMGKTTEMKAKSKSTMDAAPGSSVRRWPPAVTSQHP